LTKLIYGKKQVVRSKKSFEMHAAVASVGWLGLIVFPLYWIAKLGIAVAAGYVVCHAVYYVIFGLTICPACAIRRTCPGGKLQSVVLKR
jgi:dolichol kinase